MSATDERELFTEDFDQSPDQVWEALKHALATRDLKDADDTAHSARFSTGVSLTSWGEHMVAEVVPDGTGAQLRVRGRAKNGFLTTSWGEDAHASKVQRDLRSEIERALAG